MATVEAQANASDIRGSGRMRVRVRGVVQGVGFRPFVHALAERHGLAGWVRNDGEGVVMEVEGGRLAAFVEAIRGEAPPLARIDALDVAPLARGGTTGFEIVLSADDCAARTMIGADVAVCDACLEELFDPTDRHYRYPLLNCTHCGPRYTLTNGLPYDRVRTSMAEFPLCPECKRDYGNPRNRRFHAQPIACPACGPRLSLDVEVAVAALRAGEIVAIKGLGGFHLACDATNAAAVERLRARKHREAKPLAVMVANTASAAHLVDLGDGVLELLTSRERPIVLAHKRSSASIAPAVAGDLASLGVMLPATPLHYLLFHEAAGRPDGTSWLDRPLADTWVMTSANPAGEALVIDDDEARIRLAGIADHILGHDRAIVVRADDSVVQPDAQGGVMVRRARGYVPAALRLARPLPSVLALGGHLKATLCAVRGDEAFLSQHLGDLDAASTRTFMDETCRHLLQILDLRPTVIAHDLHPDHVIPASARDLGLPMVAVQHHHAHLAAVAAEHRHRDPLVGLALDGLGHGPDGTIWGGELLALDGPRSERLGRLRPLAQPGGDRAAREPWRMAAAVLDELGRGDEIDGRLAAWPLAAGVRSMLERDVACPRTSSLGRVFDAAAALLGVAFVNAYEGEAAMRLEALVRAPVVDAGLYEIDADGQLDLRPLLERMLSLDAVRGAELFHGTLTEALTDWLAGGAAAREVRTVALGGGCLLNRVLREGLERQLAARGLTVLVPRSVPPGDGGLSLGQAWVAGLTRAES
ncbi:MAG: carbamoyltransferase HypF [Pseudomonadota bacterium]